MTVGKTTLVTLLGLGNRGAGLSSKLTRSSTTFISSLRVVSSTLKRRTKDLTALSVSQATEYLPSSPTSPGFT